MQEFSIETSYFKDHLNFVKSGLGLSKTDLPVTVIRFTLTGDNVVMFTSNKEMFARTEFPIRRLPDSEDGSWAVLGFRLVDLMNQLESETVTVKVDAQNMEISAGFLTVNFETYDASALKVIEQGVEEHLKMTGTSIDRLVLEEAFSCGRSCTTAVSIRPDVTHVEIRDGKLLSSDGRKILMYSNEKIPEKVKIKIPSTVIANVVSCMKHAKPADHFEVIEGKSYYYLKGRGNMFSLGVRVVERDFPAVESQLKSMGKYTDEVKVDQHVLTGMIQGVSLGIPSGEVKVDVSVQGKGKDSFLEISGLNSVNRKSFERASCGRNLEKEITFPISFKHLLDTLTVFKGDSVVDIGIMLDKNMMVIKDSTQGRECMSVIPFRTQKQIEEEEKEKEAMVEARKAKGEEEGEGSGETPESEGDQVAVALE